MAEERCDSIVEVAAKLAGKADKIDQVLVLYTTSKDELIHSIDDGTLSVGDALYMLEMFRDWLLAAKRQQIADSQK